MTTRNSPPWQAGAAALFFVLAHLPFVNAPYVNYEWVFAEAAQHLLRGHPATALWAFDLKNANPLLSAVGFAAFQGLLGPYEWAARLFSLGCSAGTVWVLSFLASVLVGRNRRGVCAWLVAVNPVFLAFCGLAWSDACFFFLLSGVLMLQVMAIGDKPLWFHIWPAALLALACLTKYNAVGAYLGTGLALLALMWTKQLSARRMFGIAGVYAACGVAIVGPYLLWVHAVLGYLLAPGWSTGNFAAQTTTLRGFVTLFVLRLTAYLLWLGICVGPLGVLYWGEKRAMSRRAMWRVAVLGAVLVVVNVLLLKWLASVELSMGSLFGEMELGWITQVLPESAALAVEVLLLVVGQVTTVFFVRWCLHRQGRLMIALGWFVGLLLVHANVRGSSRYVLVLVLPVCIFLADLTVRVAARQRALAGLAFGSFVVVSLGLGGFNMAYFAAEGRAAAALAAFTNGAHVTGMRVKYGNPVLTHNFYLLDESVFADNGSPGGPCQFATFSRTGEIPDVVHVEPVRVLGRVFKRYALTCAVRQHP
jgi:hypothetical protein